MLLMDAAGIRPGVDEADAEGHAALVGVLVDTAEGFLRGGGALSLADWARLSPLERAAFVRAGNALAAEQASNAGYAAQGLEAAAAVLVPADGGAARRELALQAAAAKAAGDRRPVGAGR